VERADAGVMDGWWLKFMELADDCRLCLCSEFVELAHGGDGCHSPVHVGFLGVIRNSTNWRLSGTHTDRLDP